MEKTFLHSPTNMICIFHHHLICHKIQDYVKEVFYIFTHEFGV